MLLCLSRSIININCNGHYLLHLKYFEYLVYYDWSITTTGKSCMFWQAISTPLPVTTGVSDSWVMLQMLTDEADGPNYNLRWGCRWITLVWDTWLNKSSVYVTLMLDPQEDKLSMDCKWFLAYAFPCLVSPIGVIWKIEDTDSMIISFFIFNRMFSFSTAPLKNITLP